MSAEACRTAYDGKVPALKTLLTNPATRAAIEQLFEVPHLRYVSILRLIESLHCTISLLVVAFPFHYCVPVRGACVDAGSVCVLHVSGSMCAYAYDTCAHMLVGVYTLVSLNLLKIRFCRLAVASEEARALLAAPFMVALRGVLPARRQWQAGRRCTPTVNFGTSFF